MNRGRNRREQLRRRQVGIEEMAEGNLIDPEIDRALGGGGGMQMKRWNKKLKEGVGKRCQMLKEETFHLNMLKEVDDLNKKGTIKGPIGMHKGGGSSYNPNARKHENFSYSNPKAAVQFPPGFEPRAKPPNNEGRPSTDEMLSLIYKEMKEMREQDAKVNEYMKSNSSQIKNMEFQIGQLATTVGHMQNKGKFPSTTELNPKEHCKAIELWSGTKYQGPPLPSEDNVEEKATKIEQEKEKDKVDEMDEDEEIEPCQEDEEEKGLMKNDKEDMKKKPKEVESSHRVPKWKLAKGLKEK
ncbi:hypothetical protein ACS0TY_032383 [Phlomoides rotata]